MLNLTEQQLQKFIELSADINRAEQLIQTYQLFPTEAYFNFSQLQSLTDIYLDIRTAAEERLAHNPTPTELFLLSLYSVDEHKLKVFRTINIAKPLYSYNEFAPAFDITKQLIQRLARQPKPATTPEPEPTINYTKAEPTPEPELTMNPDIPMVMNRNLE